MQFYAIVGTACSDTEKKILAIEKGFPDLSHSLHGSSVAKQCGIVNTARNYVKTSERKKSSSITLSPLSRKLLSVTSFVFSQASIQMKMIELL